MSELKICKMGHYYAPTYHECPYCPQSSTNIGSKTTIDNKQTNNPNDKTEIFVNCVDYKN